MLAREKRNGITIAHESKQKQASAVGKSKPSIADTTYRNPENTFPFVSGFQPGCKYNISVPAFTAVRGGPFVEELTLEISSKLLSSVIRDWNSWLSKLSLDFLNINEWCIVQKNTQNHVIHLSYSLHYFVFSFINQFLPRQCLHIGKRS